MIKVLYLSLNPELRGPLPKIEPLLVDALKQSDYLIERSTWGRHSEHENLIQKFTGRLSDIKNVMLKLMGWHPDVLFVATTLDETALIRDIPLLITTHWMPVKKIMMMHGSKSAALTRNGFSIFKLMTGILIHLSDAILLLSNEEINDWSSFEPKGKYFRVDNPYYSDTDTINELKNQHARSDSNQPTLLFVGRLTREKGIYELLESMPAIIEQTNCRLLIAGDGEERENIVALIKNNHLEESVFLLGYQNDDELEKTYLSASIFILPSYREGFPAVITEAMSHGLPIITTPIRGIADHLQEGVHALFVPPMNAPAISEAVLKLLNDPKLRLKMSLSNLDKVEHFCPERVIFTYIDIFNRLLEAKVN